MFSPPYRWTYAPFKNLRHCYYDFTNGIRNIIRWVPVIWSDVDWDWASLAKIMEFKLRAMAKSAENWHHVGDDVDRRQMLICADILNRMINEDIYFDDAKKRFPLDDDDNDPMKLGVDWKRASPYIAERQREDQKYLGLLLGKYMRHWWD